MTGIFNFNLDSERVRWLKTATPEHGRSMLDRWRSEKQKQIGKVAAQEWMMELIKQAKEVE